MNKTHQKIRLTLPSAAIRVSPEQMLLMAAAVFVARQQRCGYFHPYRANKRAEQRLKTWKCQKVSVCLMKRENRVVAQLTLLIVNKIQPIKSQHTIC
jgi:hypothetical protein